MLGCVPASHRLIRTKRKGSDTAPSRIHPSRQWRQSARRQQWQIGSWGPSNVIVVWHQNTSSTKFRRIRGSSSSVHPVRRTSRSGSWIGGCLLSRIVAQKVPPDFQVGLLTAHTLGEPPRCFVAMNSGWANEVSDRKVRRTAAECPEIRIRQTLSGENSGHPPIETS